MVSRDSCLPNLKDQRNEYNDNEKLIVSNDKTEPAQINKRSSFSNFNNVPEEMCEEILSYVNKEQLIPRFMKLSKMVSRSVINRLRYLKVATVNLGPTPGENKELQTFKKIADLVNDVHLRVPNACSDQDKDEIYALFKNSKNLHAIEMECKEDEKCRLGEGFWITILILKILKNISHIETIKYTFSKEATVGHNTVVFTRPDNVGEISIECSTRGVTYVIQNLYCFGTEELPLQMRFANSIGRMIQKLLRK